MEQTILICALLLGIFMLASSIYAYLRLKTPAFAAFIVFISFLSFFSAYLLKLGRKQGLSALYATLAIHFAGLAYFEWYK